MCIRDSTGATNTVSLYQSTDGGSNWTKFSSLDFTSSGNSTWSGAWDVSAIKTTDTLLKIEDYSSDSSGYYIYLDSIKLE